MKKRMKKDSATFVQSLRVYLEQIKSSAFQNYETADYSSHVTD